MAITMLDRWLPTMTEILTLPQVSREHFFIPISTTDKSFRRVKFCSEVRLSKMKMYFDVKIEAFRRTNTKDVGILSQTPINHLGMPREA